MYVNLPFVINLTVSSTLSISRLFLSLTVHVHQFSFCLVFFSLIPPLYLAGYLVFVLKHLRLTQSLCVFFSAYCVHLLAHVLNIFNSLFNSFLARFSFGYVSRFEGGQLATPKLCYIHCISILIISIRIN